ncbi:MULTISPECIES: type I polyketide synthase [Micromonospora]|uniref:Acyltransferase domain-containing protein n=1 Tax=Micromonospora solifontis TaxID=2487138 RepID=A0ABX9WJY7_9ACTN|nr:MULTISPECIES: type I polyketide synthase [Micromonospora]NES13761.1 acyltransferase domain-containing protein [Micromonospora sp. PPF5-17B]NES35552.1 acyltransferase domain-containing protein [Micromonospora solifontis]NES55962.1 acyltransferase domain-containing protein [Micromonospora sp. PPF5-6]RNM00606.1 acyltransferase domain-containing protein [Micromonospora solifontis]
MSDAAEDPNQVAVIGMAGRFPGAADVEAFWANLVAGREGIVHLSDEELVGGGIDPELIARDNYVRAKGVLDDADLFDAGFFGFHPREAEVLDPQHRVFLECVWTALESAGYDPQTFAGRIGVFAGASLNSYLLFNLLGNQRAVDAAGSYQTLISSDKDFLATRVSYKLNLTGPSMTVQTACSTSLTAVHLAVQSLLNGECDLALAGGVSVSVPLREGYLHEQGGILSPDGRCRAFDAEARGTVPGNGAGVVVLRRMADARAAGDPVDAVIRGTAVNNDGSTKVGYTAPSVDGQAQVIAEALAVAEVEPDSIGYVEAHGTGTALGDPIEVTALTRAYRKHTDRVGYCALGSVKSNVGHLDAAAGVTSLIKAVLAVKHGLIPATLHHTRANPELALPASPFYVNTELRPWPRQAAPRRAGVSSFGIGGSNVHVILEEAPAPPATPRQATGPAAPRVLPLSARSAPALAEAAGRLAEHLAARPELDLDDVAYTLARRRRAFEHRTAVVGRDAAELVGALRRAADAGGGTLAGRDAPVAFLFPGQGAQYVGMARDLYRSEPVFAVELDRCAELFAAHLGEDLRTALFAADDDTGEAARALARTAVTQPVLFLVEYALARLWLSWGVRPAAMVGHSVGEYVAACLAGVFSLEDAVALVAARGRLVQSMPSGSMLAVFLPEAEVTGWLTDQLCLAAVNSTGLCVLAGPTPAVDGLARRLAAAGVAHRRLRTSHAFHSPGMDAAVAPFVEVVRQVALRPPAIPFLSNVTGAWITDEQATDPAYWGRHLRAPVRFADALDVLLADEELVLLEVGPGQTLRNFVRQHRAWHERRTVVGSVRHPDERRDDQEYLLAGLGELWAAGVPVDWAAYEGDAPRRPVRLPTYAFQRRRYWIHPETGPARSARPAPAAGADAPWLHVPGWRRLGPPLAAADATAPREPRWVLLGTELPFGAALAGRLAGADVLRVDAGDELRETGERSWSLEPTSRDQYAGLLKSLEADGPRTIRLVHLWSLAAEPGADLDTARIERARRVGLDSLLALAQAIGDVQPAGPVEIDVLTRGLFGVTGDEELQPENAPLLGATTVIPQEVPDVTCRVLDLTGADLAASGAASARPGAVATVLARLAAPAPERELALRGRHWWVRDFEAIRPAGEGSRLRPGGVYLITGGLGGVGLALAEQIAGAVHAPVLGLLSRTAFPAEQDWTDWLAGHGEHDETSRRIRRLARLRERGARVIVLTADVTDRDALAGAVDRLRAAGGGGLHGVIHAAGLPSRGLIAVKSAQDVADVLAAKTVGTLHLDAVCDSDQLDFLLLCSSLTGLLGGPGQSDYCAANAFLDVFAQWRRASTGAPVTAVAWDTWRHTGMAAGLVERLHGGTPLTGHPLLHRLATTTDRSRTYATTLSTADSWIVDEHRIMGHGLVPGTTYLELVTAAVAEQAASRVVELHDVLFTLPVIVPDGVTRELYTTVEERDGQLRFSVQSRGDGDAARWQEHASGTVSFHERTPEPTRDLAELRRGCAVTEVIETEDELKRRLKLDLVEQGGRLRFSFGPRWRCLRRIEVGLRRLMVTLELAEEFADDLARYPLHPALLDVAGASARIRARDVFYLPFTYRSLRVFAPLTRVIHCHVEVAEAGDSGETLTVSMELLSPEGELLVRVVDFTIKRINDIDGLLEQVDRGAVAAAGPDPAEATAGTLHRLSEGMTAAEATAAFDRLLTAPVLPEQVVVTGRDLARLRRLAASITPALLAGEVEQLAPPRGTHPRPDLDTPYVAPATDVERAVAAIWQDVLGLDRVGVHDDFFALGGHSLAAVQIGAKIRSRFGVELNLRGFFDSPTVAHTVAVLADPGELRADDRIEAVGRDLADDEAAGLDDLSDEEIESQLRALLAEEEGGGA